MDNISGNSPFSTCVYLFTSHMCICVGIMTQQKDGLNKEPYFCGAKARKNKEEHLGFRFCLFVCLFVVFFRIWLSVIGLACWFGAFGGLDSWNPQPLGPKPTITVLPKTNDWFTSKSPFRNAESKVPPYATFPPENRTLIFGGGYLRFP